MSIFSRKYVQRKLMTGTIFQGHIHQNLEEIDASYNEIARISAKTFEGLDRLTRINLDDNLITHIEKGAFVDLSSLKYIGLRGNKISHIDDEAFQTIHQLQELDLAFNRLTHFDFAMFDQVYCLKAVAGKDRESVPLHFCYYLVLFPRWLDRLGPLK